MKKLVVALSLSLSANGGAQAQTVPISPKMLGIN